MERFHHVSFFPKSHEGGIIMKKLRGTLRSLTATTTRAVLMTVILAVVAAFAVVTAYAYDKTKCDVNHDGVIDVSDGVLLFRYVQGDAEVMKKLPESPSDLNGDGEVTVADVVYVMLIIAKYDPDNPPAEYTYVETTTTVETTAPEIPWINTETTTTTATTNSESGSAADTFFTESVVPLFPMRDGKPVYAYTEDVEVTFFTLDGDASQLSLLLNPGQGVISRWTPNDAELAEYGKLPNYSDAMPPVAAFKASGKIRAYELAPWSDITSDMIAEAIQAIVDGKETNERKVAFFDYNQNTKVDAEDIAIMVRYYAIRVGKP